MQMICWNSISDIWIEIIVPKRNIFSKKSYNKLTNRLIWDFHQSDLNFKSYLWQKLGVTSADAFTERLSDSKAKMTVNYCFGKIKVNDRFVCARAGNQEELGRKLDEIVLFVLDYGLHESRGKSLSMAGIEVYLN